MTKFASVAELKKAISGSDVTLPAALPGSAHPDGGFYAWMHSAPTEPPTVVDSASLRALGGAMQAFIDCSREAGGLIVWSDSLNLTW